MSNPAIVITPVGHFHFVNGLIPDSTIRVSDSSTTSGYTYSGYMDANDAQQALLDYLANVYTSDVSDETTTAFHIGNTDYTGKTVQRAYEQAVADAALLTAAQVTTILQSLPIWTIVRSTVNPLFTVVTTTGSASGENPIDASGMPSQAAKFIWNNRATYTYPFDHA